METIPPDLPPLLKRFHQYRPGDIHYAAAKVHLEAGFKACGANRIAGVLWNEDQTALTVSFVGGVRTSLLLERSDLVCRCSCELWQPARNCPHVVVVWAVLKRLVSPGALAHIGFDPIILAKMKAYLDRELPARDSAADAVHAKPAPKNSPSIPAPSPTESGKARTFPTAEPQQSHAFCLVVSPDHEGGVCGRVMRGTETVTGWGAGLPTELSLFLLLNLPYESTSRYFEKFLAMTGGRHPIVFRDAHGRDTILAYAGDAPRTIGVVFDLRRDEVIVFRSTDKRPIPPGAVLHGKLLFDPETGLIHPVANRSGWREWDEVAGQLGPPLSRERSSGMDEGCGAGAVLGGAQGVPVTRIAVPLPRFNEAGVRIAAEKMDASDGPFSFSRDGAPAAPEQSAASHLLDLPDGFARPKVTLALLGVCDGRTFPLSEEVFWPVNPACRPRFGDHIREQKRVRAILEAAFRLMEEETADGRAAVVRECLSSPDFAKPEMKKDAERVLARLHRAWRRKTYLILASPDGFRLVEEDRPGQVRLLRILYETFGLKDFCGDVRVPGWLGVAREPVTRALPRLLSGLRKEGFSLRVGSEPLAHGTWDFSLDAGSCGVDWFELRPEIRCDGESLSVEEVRGLLEGGWSPEPMVLSREGRLILLDEASRRLLALLAEALPSGKGKGAPVRVPRLQILDWLELRKQGVSITLAPADACVMESLLDFRAIPELTLPVGLRASLRHYQADAYRWLAFLYEHRFGACLADDMGLGKTLQAITLFAGILEGGIAAASPAGSPHLVVAPPSLLFNWEAELARFLPGAKVLVHSGLGRSCATFRDYDVVVTSYGTVQRDISLMEKERFDVIVFDEAQVVKNLKAVTTRAVRRLMGSFTLALTGTPVENRVAEYYAIMDLCLPGLLGSREEFTRQIAQGGAGGVERLIQRTRPFVLRRSKELIADELPPKIEMDVHLELLPKQKALYQRTVEEVRGEVRDAYAGNAPAQARIKALTALLRLRQICLAPALAAAGASESSPKLDFLAEQLLELRDEGHSALVFSQFTSYLDLVEEGLKQHGLSCLRLDGSTPVPRRKELVQAFQSAADPSVFLISLKAGGKGLNLTRAGYVYHMDPWWNPAVENQASDRAHRIGQTGQVTITRLIMRHTIEEKMMELKERKLKLYRAILEEGRDRGGAALTREDFEFLLG